LETTQYSLYRPSRKRLKHAQTQRLAQVWAYLLRRAHADEYLHIAINRIARYTGICSYFTVGNDGARLLLLGGDAQMALEGISFVFVRPVNGKRQSRVPFNTLEKLQTSLSLFADFQTLQTSARPTCLEAGVANSIVSVALLMSA
jgi:hypothetical protein